MSVLGLVLVDILINDPEERENNEVAKFSAAAVNTELYSSREDWKDL